MKAESRPNIIFLFTDDQSSYSLGCYGNKEVQTPHIDNLSSDGMTFDHHYDTTAICMASRVKSVMTGLYEYRHGCNFEHGPLTERLWKTSYPIRLREAGYVIAFAGKFGFEVRKGFENGPKYLPESDFHKWGGGTWANPLFHSQKPKHENLRRQISALFSVLRSVRPRLRHGVG